MVLDCSPSAREPSPLNAYKPTVHRPQSQAETQSLATFVDFALLQLVYPNLLFTTLTNEMALSTFFNEPFYSLADFDRLFDEAFNARTSGAPSSAVARSSNENANLSARPMRPR